MSGFSGKGGKVKVGSTAIAEVTKWNFKPTSNNPSWGSSSSNGYKKRVAGVKDGSGSFDVKIDRSSLFLATVKEGDEVTLNLYLETHFDNATPPVEDSKYYIVPAIIDSVDVNVDVDNGEPVSATIEFSSNGAWTNPS